MNRGVSRVYHRLDKKQSLDPYAVRFDAYLRSVALIKLEKELFFQEMDYRTQYGSKRAPQSHICVKNTYASKRGLASYRTGWEARIRDS
jgi:hypothetical protein